MLIFNVENMIPQSFSFRNTTMDYICKNATASQLQKLYQTCKFFYNKVGLNIIENFEICINKEEEIIDGNSIAVCIDSPSWLQLNNLWIKSSMTYYDNGKAPLRYENISRMTYNTLRFRADNYTVEDYEFLVQPVTLRHLIIRGAIEYPVDDEFLSIEDIIERAPQVSTFDLTLDSEYFGVFPPIDMTRLTEMKRETKITSLFLNDVSKVPDAMLVVEFFKKHAIPNIDYWFDFDIYDDEYDEVNVKRFYKAVDSGIRAWKLSLQLPPRISSTFNDLTGKTALIMGATDAIGRATVILFRQLGASVIAVSPCKSPLKTLLGECQNIENTGFLHIFWSDIQFSDEFKKLFERIGYKFGDKFHILVNKAGAFADEIEPDEDIYVRESVIDAHYKIVKKAAPYLINAKGSLINVSTSNGLAVVAADTVKAAENNKRFKKIEDELVSAGVRINSVNPDSPALPRPAGMNESNKSEAQQAADAIVCFALNAGK